LRHFRRKNDAVAGLLSSASSCDSDYDSEILCDLDRKWNASTPTEDVFDELLSEEAEVEEEEKEEEENPSECAAISIEDIPDGILKDSADGIVEDAVFKYPPIPPAKPPRTMLDPDQRQSSSEREAVRSPMSEREFVRSPMSGRESIRSPSSERSSKCVKKLQLNGDREPQACQHRNRPFLRRSNAVSHEDAQDRLQQQQQRATQKQQQQQQQRATQKQQHKQGQMTLQQRLQQQQMFDKMAAAAEEDEGVFTEESSANVTPEKPVRPNKILRLSQRRSQNREGGEQSVIDAKKEKSRSNIRSVSWEDQSEKKQHPIVIESHASEEGFCAPTYAVSGISQSQQQQQPQQQQLPPSTQTEKQEAWQQQQQQQVRQRRLSRGVSWDRNAELWRQKREAAEKELEEVELETLKQFFQLDDSKDWKQREETRPKTSIREFESRIVLLPV